MHFKNKNHSLAFFWIMFSSFALPLHLEFPSSHLPVQPFPALVDFIYPSQRPLRSVWETLAPLLFTQPSTHIFTFVTFEQYFCVLISYMNPCQTPAKSRAYTSHSVSWVQLTVKTKISLGHDFWWRCWLAAEYFKTLTNMKATEPLYIVSF